MDTKLLIKMKWMLSCHSATELMEKKLRARLTLRERTGLFVHKLMCDACRRYEKHSLFIERLFEDKKQEGHVDSQTTQALEEKIIRSLEKEKK